MFRGVAQRFAQLPHRAIEGQIEVDERVGGPEPLPQLLARDDVAGMFQEQLQNLKRLIGQPNLDAAFSQLSRPEIGLEQSKSDDLRARAGRTGIGRRRGGLRVWARD